MLSFMFRCRELTWHAQGPGCSLLIMVLQKSTSPLKKWNYASVYVSHAYVGNWRRQRGFGGYEC